jgi:perosamine synthetase
MTLAADRPPRIPILPVLSSHELTGAAYADASGVLGIGTPRLLNSGAAAIMGALRLANVGAGCSVLLPAFNCPAMVDAIVSAGATPRFYRIGAELTIGPTEIGEAFAADTRAVLVPHLFGRVQELLPIKELCEQRGALLIEDCAHAMFGALGAAAVGGIGHFAAASPRKFLPLMEGGLLTSASRDVALLPDLRRPGVLRAARMAFDGVDIATQSGHLRGLRPFVKLLKKAAGSRPVARDAGATQAGAPVAPTSKIELSEATATTRLLLRRSLTQEAMRRRSDNYDYLVRNLRRVAGAQVLDAADPRSTGTVPYMVPLLLDQPDRQFDELKGRGMPMWRWEYSVRGQCDVTDWYARALVQLPCHQSLRRADLDWMIARVDDVFGATRRRAGADARSASASAASAGALSRGSA